MPHTHSQWLEISVRVNGEAAEAVAEVLTRYAPQGVVFDLDPEKGGHAPVTVKAYLAVDEALERRKREIEIALGHLSHIWSAIPEPAFRLLPDQDWMAQWKDQIPVLHLGKRIVIKPSWREYVPAPGEIVLEMDPGLAFGTGLHPTTRLCVSAIEQVLEPGTSVLDLGTGTGILAMVAARLGAGRVLAVDHDENAVVAARRNIRANHLAREIEVRHGSLKDISGRYDLVVANILAPVIIEMAHNGLATRVEPGGTLIVSGILEEQAQEVVDTLHAVGLEWVDTQGEEEWVAILLRRPGGALNGQARVAT